MSIEGKTSFINWVSCDVNFNSFTCRFLCFFCRKLSMTVCPEDKKRVLNIRLLRILKNSFYITFLKINCFLQLASL